MACTKSIMPPSTARLQIAHRGLRLAFAAVRLRQSSSVRDGSGFFRSTILTNRIGLPRPQEILPISAPPCGSASLRASAGGVTWACASWRTEPRGLPRLRGLTTFACASANRFDLPRLRGLTEWRGVQCNGWHRSSPPEGVDPSRSFGTSAHSRSSPPEGVDREEER